MSEKLKATGIFVGAVLARAVSTAGTTAVRNHRELSHRSATLHPVVAKAFDAEQRAAGINSNEWAGNHRRHHHQFPDADLHAFWKIAKTVEYMRETGNQEPLPETFKGLDPLVEEFALEDVLTLGQMADNYLHETLGDEYRAPTDYSDGDIHRTLHLESPRYYYDESFFDKKKIFSDDEVAHILLRDQHSPLLAPPKADGSHNGVRYVAMNNLKLSNVPTRMYRQRPSLLPADLRPESLEPVGSNASEVAAGFVAFGLLALIARRDYSAKGFVKAGLIGSAINGAGLAFLDKASGVVNAFGHMGEMTPETIRAALFNKNFEITPYSDGTIASDTKDGGVIGKVMSYATMDEAGKQAGHHLYPGAIAFTDREGNASFADAPFGTVVEKLADSKYFPLINRGPGFPESTEQKRADMPGPVMDLLHELRAIAIRAKQNRAA